MDYILSGSHDSDILYGCSHKLPQQHKSDVQPLTKPPWLRLESVCMNLMSINRTSIAPTPTTGLVLIILFE